MPGGIGRFANRKKGSSEASTEAAAEPTVLPTSPPVDSSRPEPNENVFASFGDRLSTEDVPQFGSPIDVTTSKIPEGSITASESNTTACPYSERPSTGETFSAFSTGFNAFQGDTAVETLGTTESNDPKTVSKEETAEKESEKKSGAFGVLFGPSNDEKNVGMFDTSDPGATGSTVVPKFPRLSSADDPNKSNIKENMPYDPEEMFDLSKNKDESKVDFSFDRPDLNKSPFPSKPAALSQSSDLNHGQDGIDGTLITTETLISYKQDGSTALSEPPGTISEPSKTEDGFSRFFSRRKCQPTSQQHRNKDQIDSANFTSSDSANGMITEENKPHTNDQEAISSREKDRSKGAFSFCRPNVDKSPFPSESAAPSQPSRLIQGEDRIDGAFNTNETLMSDDQVENAPISGPPGPVSDLNKPDGGFSRFFNRRKGQPTSQQHENKNQTGAANFSSSESLPGSLQKKELRRSPCVQDQLRHLEQLNPQATDHSMLPPPQKLNNLQQHQQPGKTKEFTSNKMRPTDLQSGRRLHSNRSNQPERGTGHVFDAQAQAQARAQDNENKVQHENDAPGHDTEETEKTFDLTLRAQIDKRSELMLNDTLIENMGIPSNPAKAGLGQSESAGTNDIGTVIVEFSATKPTPSNASSRNKTGISSFANRKQETAGENTNATACEKPSEQRAAAPGASEKQDSTAAVTPEPPIASKQTQQHKLQSQQHHPTDASSISFVRTTLARNELSQQSPHVQAHTQKKQRNSGYPESRSVTEAEVKLTQNCVSPLHPDALQARTHINSIGHRPSGSLQQKRLAPDGALHPNSGHRPNISGITLPPSYSKGRVIPVGNPTKPSTAFSNQRHSANMASAGQYRDTTANVENFDDLSSQFHEDLRDGADIRDGGDIDLLELEVEISKAHSIALRFCGEMIDLCEEIEAVKSMATRASIDAGNATN